MLSCLDFEAARPAPTQQWRFHIATRSRRAASICRICCMTSRRPLQISEQLTQRVGPDRIACRQSSRLSVAFPSLELKPRILSRASYDPSCYKRALLAQVDRSDINVYLTFNVVGGIGPGYCVPCAVRLAHEGFPSLPLHQRDGARLLARCERRVCLAASPSHLRCLRETFARTSDKISCRRLMRKSGARDVPRCIVRVVTMSAWKRITTVTLAAPHSKFRVPIAVT